MKIFEKQGHPSRRASWADPSRSLRRPCLPFFDSASRNLQKVIDLQSFMAYCSVVSVIQARKERERAAREELILDHAQRMLLKDGFQNLNLDELAEAVEYSKGTLYLHFKTKEDIALAVVTRVLKERADFFERAAQFKGRSRERVGAIG